MRTSNAGPPGSSTTEESLSSSIARSPSSVSELKAETRKLQAQLRDVQSEMQRLREAKTEAVRTGYAPSDGLVVSVHIAGQLPKLSWPVPKHMGFVDCHPTGNCQGTALQT